MENKIEIKSFLKILNDYELAIIQNSDNLIDSTIFAIKEFTSIYSKISLFDLKVSSTIIDNFYTRFAAIITNCCINNKFDLSIQQIEKISLYKTEIVYIFSISGFRNTKHLISVLSEINIEGLNVINKKNR